MTRIDRPLRVELPFIAELDELHEARSPKVDSAIDAYEAGEQILRISFDDPAIPEPAAVAHGRALAAKGNLDEALRTLSGVIRDGELAKNVRGQAAVLAGKLAHENNRPAAAEYFAHRADQLAPQLESTRRLRLSLLVGERATSKVLALVDELLREFPKDTSLLRIRSNALIEDAAPEEAVLSAEKAWKLVRANDKSSPQEVARTGGAFAFALTKANQSAKAVEILEECLELAPHDASLHARIAEYVQPDFADKKKRAAIKKKFDEANQLWQAGDDQAVKKKALEILEIDKGDGLAHHLYSSANERAHLRARGVLHQIDEPREQAALIEKLEEVCGRATIKNKSGSPESLFPEWKQLTQEQRACVAYSVLGFAKVIPAIIEKGTKFHFAMPGTSLCEIDPNADITKKKAFGRMSYSGRGWAYHKLNQVYCGLERVDGAARGDRNTVTHEFAHVVHYHLRDLADKKKAEGKGALSDEENILADTFGRVESLYQEARDHRDGQKLLDAYSGTNVWEYFAQGMMGYLAMTDRLKESAPRLYSRNPSLFRIAASLSERLAEFPQASPGPQPPATNMTEAGAVRELLALVESSAKRHVLAQAKVVLGLLVERFESDPRPYEARKEEERVLLGRAEELVLVDQGKRSPKKVSEAGAVLALMPPPALGAMLLQLLEQATTKGERPPELVDAYRLLKREQTGEAREKLEAFLT
jgi:hypothetical protein